MNLRYASDSSHPNTRIRRVAAGGSIIATAGPADEVPPLSASVLSDLAATPAWIEIRDTAR